MFALLFFAAFNRIPMTAKDGCSYRKVGMNEFQSDASYYRAPRKIPILRPQATLSRRLGPLNCPHPRLIEVPYIGETADATPWGTQVIDLDQYPRSTLVIEVADTSLADDLGAKRFLYEELAIREYWMVNQASTSEHTGKIQQGVA